jgi:hypothetical protein
MANGLGLLPYQPPTDQLYPLAAAPRFQAAVALRTVRWPLFRTALHQGSEGTCTGHAGQVYLEAAPIVQVGRRPVGSPNQVALELYDAGWLIENGNGLPDRSTGLTLDSLFKVMRDWGYVAEWRHTTDPDEVIRWVGGADETGRAVGGPMIVGVPWFASQDSPDVDGTVHVDPGSGLRGYHAVTVLEYHAGRDEVIFANSWSAAWGARGYGKFSRAALHTLFGHYGHAVVASEIRRA